MTLALKILTSNSTRTVLDALIPAYEKSTGNKVSISADSAKAMVARIRGGESGDVVILGSAAVKELGKKSEQDHTQAGTELAALAKAKNVPLPADAGGEKAMLDKMSSLSGTAFDKAYT